VTRFGLLEANARSITSFVTAPWVADSRRFSFPGFDVSELRSGIGDCFDGIVVVIAVGGCAVFPAEH